MTAICACHCDVKKRCGLGGDGRKSDAQIAHQGRVSCCGCVAVPAGDDTFAWNDAQIGGRGRLQAFCFGAFHDGMGQWVLGLLLQRCGCSE